MTYYLFLDESGDHGLARIDSQFPMFVLCGILISQDDNDHLKTKITELKKKLWGNKKLSFIPGIFENAKKSFLHF